MISSLSRLAALGPPSNVTLAPAGSDLDVVVTDPLTSNNTSMREHVPNLYYHVQYWERQADGQVGSSSHFSVAFSPRACVCACVFILASPKRFGGEQTYFLCESHRTSCQLAAVEQRAENWFDEEKQVTAARPKISRARDERVDDEGERHTNTTCTEESGATVSESSEPHTEPREPIRAHHICRRTRPLGSAD